MKPTEDAPIGGTTESASCVKPSAEPGLSDYTVWYRSLPSIGEVIPDSLRPAADALQELDRSARPSAGPSHLVQSYQDRRRR
jgi:hypothetical protein